ncbi:MAG: putative exonuclease [Frankiales bacterium]|nr:putative exonuclease [Frankiales bacterium]
MRLHTLTMTAIGPFADRVDVDFARLGQAGLFLLEGPTGAGKSTVIDAISFALYGKVAQRAGDGGRLRSHHAAPSTEPVVELVFETQAGRYRIRRTPSYERPKKSGTGTTPAHMSVKLWRLGPEDATGDGLDGGELLSNRIGEAEDEITRAVGLTHEQFVQTMVLPQGEFATFLRSKTEDKKDLLRRLFGTEIVSRMQRELEDARRVAEQARGRAIESVGRALHGFLGAAGLDQSADEPMPAADLTGADLAVRVELMLADLHAAERAANRVMTAATKRAKATQRELDRALDWHRRAERRRRLGLDAAALAARAPDLEVLRTELRTAERAVTVQDSAEALTFAITRSEQAQDDETTMRVTLPAELRAAELSALRAASVERRTVIGALAADVERETALAAHVEQQRAIARTLQELTQLSALVGTELAALPDALSALAAERELVVDLAGGLKHLPAELNRARARLAAAKQAAELAESAAIEEQITATVLADLIQLEHRTMTLRLSRVASMAGELGLKLRDGDPCEVCGSLDHPQPARPTDAHVSQQQVEGAEKDLTLMRTTANKYQERLTEQRSELAQLRVAADQLTPEQAAQKVAELQGACAAAEQAALRSTELDAELIERHARQDGLAQQLAEATVQRAGLTERHDAVSLRVDDDVRRLATARDGHESVPARIDALKTDCRRLDGAVDAVLDAATALATARHCGEEFQAALARAGFEHQRDWQDARRDTARLSELRAVIREFDDALVAVQRALAEPELNTEDLQAPAPDQLAADRAAQDADEARQVAVSAHGSARDRYESAANQASRLIALIDQHQVILRDTAPAIRVGNLTAGLGENRLRMELTTFVLTQRFADVVAAANHELRRMSSGRYELAHSSVRSGSARSGLGLLVQDLHTGRSRDPGTLSGGETFYVSLALALGLADVVRAESGGVELGTLFVDEGFGSLDPEVLDEVLDVLDGLRAGGRTVGVVSHVPELKARIPDRIEVRRNPDGSSRLQLTT